MAREMKDSGIEWIGKIPQAWALLPARYAFSEIRKRNTDGSVTNALKFFNGTIIRKSNFDADSDNYVAETITSYTIVEPNTIMINGLNLNYDLKSLRVGLVREKGVITSAYLALWPNTKRIIPEYANYLFKGYETKMAFHNMGAGIRKTLGFKEFKCQPVLFPSLHEQQRIVNFLDSKCAEIDRVIAETQKTIEEYKALKQSIITEAVTKGIRPNRPMKDSGVEWIGEIPEDWECKPIKYVADFQPKCDTSSLQADSEITYLPMDCLKNGYYVSNTAKYGSIAPSLTPFEEGDIVIAKVTPCFENGNIALMKNLLSGFGMGSSELFVYRPISINPQYLLYWLQNDLFKNAACATMTGTGGLKRVSPYFAQHIKITVPSTEEQYLIVDYLNSKCYEIDRLIETKHKLLTELDTFRKSVIYEYVTGKREVV